MTMYQRTESGDDVTASPRMQHHRLRHMRKLDLILLHDNGHEYDESGCLFPCIPGCSKPIYQAGQMISGYLLVRPTKKVTITDVSVHFGGKFETKWTDAHMQYSSQSVIYAEEQRVIRNRKIPLDCRWYRFDFEHRIPSSLPTSFKHHEGRLLFYASGVLLRDNGALLETLNAHFHVKGRTDIDGLPAVLHESVRRKQSRVFEKCPSATRQKQHNHNHNAIGLESARAPLRHDEDDDVTSLDSDGEQRQVKAAISLNSQAFAHGQHVIAEVTLDNSTNGQVSYTAKFEQVMTFEADFVRPSVGGQRNPTAQVPHSKTSSKVLAASPLIRVDPGCTEASSCMFDIPAVIPSTPSRYMLPGVSHLGIRRPLITIAYFVKLEIKPEWHEDGFNIPVEIKIGSIDSNIRNQNSPEAEVLPLVE